MTKEQYPGVITGTLSDFDPTGQANTLTWGGAVGDQFAYTYDGFGNLHQQARSLQAGYTETYAYDTLQRLTSATRNGTTVNYTYSASGNLTQKSDYGSTYTYAPANTHTNGCGPHAVNVAGAYSYTCDGNGNVIGGNTLAMTYDFENFARTATRSGTGSATWAHDANGQIDFSSSKGNRFYAPDGYEQVGSGSTAQQIHELGPVVVTRTGGLASSDTVSVVLRDRLGSTIDVIDNDTPTTRSYDAFGKPISGSGNLLSPPALNLTDTIHGFTKHEHDDSVLLINTVGRLYDYQLGRFLQVDPVISGSGSQALNPYSYIGNNPLSGTDPTGYECVNGNGTNGCVSTADQIDGLKTIYSYSDFIASMRPQQNGSILFNMLGAGGYAPGKQIGGTPTGNTPTVYGGQPSASSTDGCQAPMRCDGGATQDYGTITGLPPSPHERMQALAEQSRIVNPLGAVGTDILDTALTNAFQIWGAVSGSRYNAYTEMSVNGVYPGLTAAAALGLMALPAEGATEGFVESAIQQGVEKQTATLIVGEGMNRVEAMAAQLREFGIEARTYAAENMNRLMNPNAYGSSRSLDANRHWLDYWARQNGADVIDIGRQPGRTTASPYYEMESRNLQRWGESGQIAPVVPVNPGY